MNTDCVNCKHARLWTDKEQFEYIERMFNLIGRMPCRADHYICDKIPKGTEWTEDGNTCSYDGYSLDGENYDEVFHCFEPQESDNLPKGGIEVHRARWYDEWSDGNRVWSDMRGDKGDKE